MSTVSASRTKFMLCDCTAIRKKTLSHTCVRVSAQQQPHGPMVTWIAAGVAGAVVFLVIVVVVVVVLVRLCASFYISFHGLPPLSWFTIQVCLPFPTPLFQQIRVHARVKTRGTTQAHTNTRIYKYLHNQKVVGCQNETNLKEAFFFVFVLTPYLP